MRVQNIEFSPKLEASSIYVSSKDELPHALGLLDIKFSSRVIVLVGGASKVQKKYHTVIRSALQSIASIAEKERFVLIDGGTDSGIMATIGRVRREASFHFSLIGVATKKLVTWPTNEQNAISNADIKQVPLEPNHSHFILVPGDTWGDESPWICEVANQIAKDQPSITILINGGEISRMDVDLSEKVQRPVIVLKGTGRLADELATKPTSDLIRPVSIAEIDKIVNDMLSITHDAH